MPADLDFELPLPSHPPLELTMATDPLQLDKIEQLSAMLRGILREIEDGKMTASSAARYRLEGAVVALAAVLGELDDLRERLLEDRV